jgi:serine/threonine protein kinase
MPFIEGEELASIIQRNEKLPIARIMKIARGIATGLEAAHAAGVVHRDLKPANIMVDREDEAMIMDFGIARSAGGAPKVQEVNIRTQGAGRPTRRWSGPWSERCSTWRRNRPAPSPSINAPTSTRSD